MNLFYRFALAILFIVISQIGNTRVINYDYDEAGNRIRREIVINSRRIAENSGLIENFSEVLAQKGIRIYPNPTKGVLKVEIVGYESTDMCLMQVFNMEGVQVLSIRPSEQESNLDLSNFSNGMYILNLLLNGEYCIWKIIKE